MQHRESILRVWYDRIRTLQAPTRRDSRNGTGGQITVKKARWKDQLASPHAYGALGYGRLANALREPRASHIYFVVRHDESHSDILFQTSDTTWQAYNPYGGYCTYGTG